MYLITVADMLEKLGDIAVATPDVESIETTDELKLLQTPPDVADESVTVLVGQNAVAPTIGAGNGLTVTCCVIRHPVALARKVITAVPNDMPDTKPDPATDAIEG